MNLSIGRRRDNIPDLDHGHEDARRVAQQERRNLLVEIDNRARLEDGLAVPVVVRHRVLHQIPTTSYITYTITARSAVVASQVPLVVISQPIRLPAVNFALFRATTCDRSV